MATKNIKVIGSNKAKDDTAGPGHRPTKPHPTPKSKDPIISFLSKPFFCGRWISQSNKVLFLFFNK
jgi:hypothetical protein